MTVRRAASLAFLIAGLGAGAQAIAEWQVTTVTDAMTDKKTELALTKSSDGYTLAIVREDDETAWLSFVVPNAAPPVDTVTDKGPLFRIDKLDAHDVAFWKTVQRLVPSTGTMLAQGPRAIRLLMNYNRRSPVAGELREIMDGKSLLYRYYTIGGTHQDVEFELAGAKTAIASLLHISEEPDPDDVARYQAITQARAKCTDKDVKSPCMQTVTKCASLKDRTSKAALDCLKGIPK